MKYLITLLLLTVLSAPAHSQLIINTGSGQEALSHSKETRDYVNQMEQRLEKRLVRIEENINKTTIVLDSIIERLNEKAEPASSVELVGGTTKTNLKDEEQPTPEREIITALNALDIKEDETFVDFGCGPDARVVILASRIYGCRSIGIEIDPERARAARSAVSKAGLEDSIEIITGDALETHVNAQVGFVYLYPETLSKLRPKLEKLDRYASYLHFVPGANSMAHAGNSYVWRNNQRVSPSTQPTTTSKVQTQVVRTQGSAVWGGRSYSGRVCNNPSCQMCNSIAAQLNSNRITTRTAQPSSSGRWVTVKVKRCTNGRCWYENVRKWVQN